MIVDDSRIVFAEMKKLLADSDIEIAYYCRSGEEAISSYGDIRPDLVTMDIIMPGMDGLDTTRALLEKWPDARVLMVSSLAYDDTMDKANELGAKGFVYKPFTRETLISAIHQALGL